MNVHVHIHPDQTAKVAKAVKPSRKPKEEPGLLMKNMAMKLYSARQRNG